ncbi:MAG: hypothetical protein HYZ52_03630, partial [Candidatus Omnitrophica bacterium]|nr:hypothetical protein [Candidatus Omnitrophota bacterium]
MKTAEHISKSDHPFKEADGEKYLDQRRKDRLALFCNVHKDDVISSPDLPSVYEIPLVLNKQELDKKVLKKLGLPVRTPNLKDWIKFVENTKNTKQAIEIAIVGKYFG